MGVSKDLSRIEPGSSVTCPHCGSEIPLAETDLGSIDEGQILCPRCQGSLQVPDEARPA